MKSPTRRQTDLVIALSLAAQLVIPRAAAAQSEIRYSFYHGDKDNSAWVQPGAADAYQRLSARQLTTSARAGSRVCVLVINGNTVNYAYSLGVAVDSTGPAMPDLSKQLLPLAEFINLPKSVDQAKKEASAAASLTSNARTAVATARNTAANAAANAVAATPGKNPAPSAPGATQPSVNATSRLVEATREKAASDAEVLRSTAALNEALAIERAAQKKLADAERTAAALTDFIKKVMPIDSDVVAARKFVQAADHAEPLAKYADPLASGFGLRYAKQSLAKLPQEKGRFNDNDLKGTIDAWASDARKALGDDSELLLAVSALQAYAHSLRDTRDQLKKSIGDATINPQVCEKVSKGTTTFTLKAAQKDSAVAKERIFGKDEVYTIVNDAPMERKTVELHPVAIGVSAPGESDFYVENGILRADHSKVMFRPGIVIDGLVGSTASGSVGLSVGLGMATALKDAPISDLFVSAGIDFFSIFRVGLGIGASNVPVHVKNTLVNAAFPADKKLEDEIVRDIRPALYLTFVLPGFNPSW